MSASNRNLIIALLLIPQMIVVRVLARYPDIVERYYSTGIYPLISKAFRAVFGWLPFSFGDVMYAGLIILILRSFYLGFKNRFRNIWNRILHLGAIASVVYFTFHILWGLNYYRQPLHTALSIDREYTTEDLTTLAETLIAKSNALHDQLAVNDTTAVQFPQTKEAIFDQTLQGFEALQRTFPKLDYPPKSLKVSLLSYPLTVMGYSGYLNPISLEAQVNGMIPTYRLPLVSCHEMAHQLGFAKENEANFIGTMATLNNEDLYFQYSGSVFALRYVLNDLYRRDKELGLRFRESVHRGILKNWQESRDFWTRYDNPLEPVFDFFYGNYLKANNQPDGLKTYSYFVALLVNYHKEYPEVL